MKLLGDYLLPFEIVSVLLLAVMIGAAYLAKARRREASESASAARGLPWRLVARARRLQRRRGGTGVR